MFYLSVYAKRVTFANCYWLYLFCCYLLLSTMSMMLSIKRMSSVELIKYTMKGDWHSSKVWFFLCFANIWIQLCNLRPSNWIGWMIQLFHLSIRNIVAIQFTSMQEKSEKRTKCGVGMVWRLYDAGGSRLKHF